MKVTLIFALSILSTLCDAEPKVTYVGDGRYVCSGSRSECAATEQRNEQREQQRLQRAMLEEQRKQTAILEEIRTQQRKQN